jgi:hypothetical protein
MDLCRMDRREWTAPNAFRMGEEGVGLDIPSFAAIHVQKLV